MHHKINKSRHQKVLCMRVSASEKNNTHASTTFSTSPCIINICEGKTHCRSRETYIYVPTKIFIFWPWVLNHRAIFLDQVVFGN